MATVTGSGTLSALFEMTSSAGFVMTRQGQLDPVTGTIKPLAISSWRQLQGTTWGNFQNYQQQPQQIIWTADLQDLGEVRYFTLNIETQLVGNVESYTVYTSETGVFGGEEVVTIINDGDYDIPAFYGRYFYIQVKATAKELLAMDFTASNETETVRLNNVNTSTLTGTSAARTLSLEFPVSKVLDIDIKPIAPSPYAVNLYVSDTATSKVLIPMVLSKASNSAQIALFGIDNDARDGVVDITLTCLPRQVMGGGNLYVVTAS